MLTIITIRDNDNKVVNKRVGGRLKLNFVLTNWLN